MPTPTATFRCGHARTPANIKWRKRSGAAAKHRSDEGMYQACCRTCHQRRQAEAARRARARQQQLKDELYNQLPPDLPPIEPAR